MNTRNFRVVNESYRNAARAIGACIKQGKAVPAETEVKFSLALLQLRQFLDSMGLKMPAPKNGKTLKKKHIESTLHFVE